MPPHCGCVIASLFPSTRTSIMESAFSSVICHQASMFEEGRDSNLEKILLVFFRNGRRRSSPNQLSRHVSENEPRSGTSVRATDFNFSWRKQYPSLHKRTPDRSTNYTARHSNHVTVSEHAKYDSGGRIGCSACSCEKIFERKRHSTLHSPENCGFTH